MEKHKIDFSQEELEEIARGDRLRIEEGSAPLQNDDEREAFIVGLLDDMERKQRVPVPAFALVVQEERRELVKRWDKLRFARNERLKREEEAAKQRALDEKVKIDFSQEELEEIKRLEQTRGIPFKNDAERERTILQSLQFLDGMEAEPQFYQSEENLLELTQLKAVREGRAERKKREEARELEARRIEVDRREAESREARELEEQKRKAREREAEAKEEQKRLERKKKKAAATKSPRTPLKSKTAGKRTPSKPWKPRERVNVPTVPAKGKGERWIKVFDADIDKIRNSQAPNLFPLAFAVWYALNREASYRRTLTFEASDSYLSNRTPGVKSRHTVRKATTLLESLGMLKSESRLVLGTKNREPLLRTLSPSGDLLRPQAPADHKPDEVTDTGQAPDDSDTTGKPPADHDQ